MGEREQVVYMQIRIARMFAESRGITLAQSARMLDACGAFQYIADCWDVFHVEGDEAVLDDVVSFMAAKDVGSSSVRGERTGMASVEERNLVAMDLTAMMVVCQVADASGCGPGEVLPDFLASHTAMLLYDDSYKLWWDGPDEVADRYLAESGSAIARHDLS